MGVQRLRASLREEERSLGKLLYRPDPLDE
jgi:hypothetical protein